MTGALLQVEGLSVDYRSGRHAVRAVRDVSFTVAAGETVALVGGSGSGKSTTAHAIVRLLPDSAVIGGGSVVLGGTDVTALRPRALRSVRGARVGLIPQDPAVSLNPVLRVGRQVAEVLVLHGLADRRSAPHRAVDALAAAGLDQPEVRARQFPHELSGGMRQRVLIAIALAARPSLVIADEATSALDVTVQRQVLDHLEQLTSELGTSVLMITHDLGVAADRADRILVMHQGRLVEEGTPAQVLAAPAHPYTRSLIEAAPSLAASGGLASGGLASGAGRSAAGPGGERVPAGTAGPPGGAAPPDELVLQARNLVKDYLLPAAGGGKTTFRAVSDVSLAVGSGETLGLVGESGSGKTTLARMLLRLTAPTSGSVLLDGADISAARGEALRQLRQQVQYVFQNPYTSLHPKMSAKDIVADPLRSFGIGTRAQQREQALAWLERVGLPAAAAQRRPAELSGGQRQRVAIARALIVRPRVVVLDEPVSALDVLIQAQILDLLASLRQEFGVSYLFISHDLAVVRRVAHRVAVMAQGRLVEEGPVEQVLGHPRHEFTQQLVAAIPGQAKHRIAGPSPRS